MKKVFTIIIAGIISMGIASAQQTSIGVTGGVGHAWLSEQDNVIFNPVFNLGGTFIYSTAEHWAFGLDVKFSREGFKRDYMQNGYEFTAKNNLDYIRVPVRVTYFINDYEHSVRPKISLAPTFGFLTGAHQVISDADGDKLYSNEFKDSFNSFDFGLTGAIGANFRMSDKIWFTTELAYYNGFLAVNKDGDDNIMNRNLSLNLGLTFGIGE